MIKTKQKQQLLLSFNALRLRALLNCLRGDGERVVDLSLPVVCALLLNHGETFKCDTTALIHRVIVAFNLTCGLADSAFCLPCVETFVLFKYINNKLEDRAKLYRFHVGMKSFFLLPKFRAKLYLFYLLSFLEAAVENEIKFTLNLEWITETSVVLVRFP